MNNDFSLFIRITDHLEFLSTHSTLGVSRSKNISSMSDLSIELNTVGIVPKRGHWTSHSLECFISRLRSRYGTAYLHDAADCRFIGASDWEWQSATTARELMRGLDVIPKKVRDRVEPTGRRYIASDCEVWHPHEEPELLREQDAMIRTFLHSRKNI